MGFLTGLFKHTLLVLEQLPFVLLQILGVKVDYICPFEHLSTIDDLFCALFQEFELFGLELTAVM